MDAGATLTINNNGDDSSNVTVNQATGTSDCTFGDGDGVVEASTVNGTGFFIAFSPCNFKRAGGSVDSATFSIATFWLQMSAAANLLTIEDNFPVTFSGASFVWIAGSMSVGTSSANAGSVTIADASVGVSGETTMAGQIHTLTVNGAAGVRFLAQGSWTFFGDGVGGGGRAVVIVNDAATAQFGDALADSVTMGGGETGGSSTGNPASVVVGNNAGSTAVLGVAGDLSLTSNTFSGGNLTVNNSGVANITGNLNANLTATASHKGGTVNINSTGRVAVTGNLTVQGNSTGTTTGALVTMSSTRTATAGLEVTGTTSLTAGTVSKGQINVAAAGLVILNGATTIGTNGAIFDVSYTGAAPGPEVRFRGNVTVDGNWDPAPAGVWTCTLKGSAAQTFGGATLTVDFSTLRFESTTARTVSFSNADTVYAIANGLTSGNTAASTVDATAARTFQVAGNLTFDQTITFSTNTTVRLNGTAAQTVGGTAATGPTFLNLTLANTTATPPTNITYGGTWTTLTTTGALLVSATTQVAQSVATKTIDTKGPDTFDATYTQSSGEFKLSGAAAQTIGGAAATGPTFQDLTLANTTATPPANITYGGTWGTLTTNGTLLVSTTTQLAQSAATKTLDTKGADTFDATYTQSSGVFKLSGAAAQTIGGAAATGPTFQDLTLANTTATPPANVTYGGTWGTLTTNGTLLVSTTTQLAQSAATKTLAVANSVWTTALTLESGTLTLGNGTHTLNGAVIHTMAGGTTLNLTPGGGTQMTIDFTAAATLVVNGAFNSLWTSGFKPRIRDSGALGRANLDLRGATVDVSGMTYSNGNGNGLEFGQAGGPYATVLQFRNVDFTVAPAGGRHMTFTGPGGSKVVGIDCTFDTSFGAAGANVQVNNDGGGNTVVSMIRGLGGPGGGGEGPFPNGPDADADGTGPAATGYCDWFDGGDQLTRSAGPGTEVRTNPDTFEGVQGFLTAQYNWFSPYAFVGNYALVRSDEDKDLNDDGDVADAGEPSSTGNGTKEDLVYALDATGKIKAGGAYTTTNPFRVPRTLGRVIGPPWTATLGAVGPGTDVVMFVTDLGYVYVIQDTVAGGLQLYAPFPKRAWSNAGVPGSYVPTNITKAYCPLLLWTGDTTPGVAGDADDRFIFCGENAGTFQVYVTDAFVAGQQARCSTGWPLNYGVAVPSRSWPAFQFLAADRFLHIATDFDAAAIPPRAHIFRIKMDLTPVITQEYGGPSTPPVGHVRGGIQMLDDPAFDSDAEVYVGCYENADGTNDPNFYSIRTDSPVPANYVDRWPVNAAKLSALSGLTGDVDSYATFDSGQIYVGDSDGILYCMKRSDGTAGGAAQPLEAGQPIRSSPVSFVNRRGSGRLFVGNDNGKVFERNPATGAPVRTWRLGDGRKVRSLSIVGDAANDYIVAITSDGYAFLIKVP